MSRGILVDMSAVINDKLSGVNNGLLGFADEWHVPAPPAVSDLLNLSRENLNFINRRSAFFGLRSRLGADYPKHVTTDPDQRQGITERSIPL